MYATNLHDQLINAALPLKPLTAWAGSACTVTVAVPPVQSLAGITVDTVTVTLALPSGNVVTQNAAPVSGSPNWAATFSADNFATSGFVSEGFAVSLVGKDETGTNRIWIVSKGDLDIRPGDASTSPGGSYFVVKLRDIAPAAPTKADAYISGGTLYIYDGTAWAAIGGSSISVDPTLTVEGAAADAKAVGDALRGGFTEWEFSGSGYDSTKTYSVLISQSSLEENYDYDLKVDGVYADTVYGTSECPTSIDFAVSSITATRHLITPTKTSQLTNDGNGTSAFATVSQIPTVPSAYTSTPAMDGVGAAGSSTAWAKGDHVHPSDTSKANITDLPYRLVEPGEWEFSGSGYDPNKTYRVRSLYTEGGDYIYFLESYDSANDDWVMEDEPLLNKTATEMSLIFSGAGITATRASLPGHLCDRAGNRVVVSGDTTLTLPTANPGYLRDFLVRLEISGSTVPTITFAAPTGETITYETDGDEFPVPDEAGTWSYSFTENCVAHKFAVSLKKVNVVAQGGS